MTSLDSLPDEILRGIIRCLKEDADAEDDLTFYAMTYVNDKFRLMALEVYHNQNSATWSKKKRTRKMAKLREAEGSALLKKIVRDFNFSARWRPAETLRDLQGRANIVKSFERGRRVENMLLEQLPIIYRRYTGGPIPASNEPGARSSRPYG